MKIVILCGGVGIRLKDSHEFIPKGMVKIGHRPLLWHVMKIYSQFGFTEFILALGYGGKQIRDYFINYDENINDLTLTLGSGEIKYNSKNNEDNWKITFVETGEDSNTGSRLFRCEKYLDEDKDFMLTYSDSLANIDIKKLLAFHKKHKKIATVTGVIPPYRYGEFMMKNGHPIEYRNTSRLKSENGWVCGGFMILNSKVFKYLSPYNECVLEKEVFTKLVEDKQIEVFQHEDFWQCLDNEREFQYLNGLVKKNSEYWLRKRHD